MRLDDVIHEQTGSRKITVNSSLNPKLWDGDELRGDVRNSLLRIADHFEKFIGVDLDVVDYTITGSNAN